MRASPLRRTPPKPLSRSAAAVLAWALVQLPATPSYAAPELHQTAALADARDPTGQKAAAVADAILHAKVRKARTLRLIEPGRVLSGDPRTREEETLERSRAAFADGRRAYDALNLDEAIARLGQAVNLYQQTGPLLGDAEELLNALVYLGSALTLRGSADEGESTFVELLTIDPAHQLDGFPPAVMKTFENAAARIERAPTGSVEIYSTPPYGTVYLDGRFVGVTPVTLSDLVAGTHYLRIEKVGYTVHGAPLEISANQRITSQTRLRSMKKGVELRDVSARCTEEVLQEGMGGNLRTLSRMLVADTLIFISVTQSGNDASFTGGVFDVPTGTRITTERAVISVSSATFGTELDAYIGRLVKAAERGGTDEPEAGAGGGSESAFGLAPGGGTGSVGGFAQSGGGGAAYSGSMTNVPPGGATTQLEVKTSSEEYLGWTLIGLGAASVITGSVFGILAKGVHDDFQATSQASPDLRGISDTGKTDALVADICIGAGVGTAIGGTIILLIAHRSGPTPEELLRNPRTAFVPTDGGAIFSFGADLP